MRNRTYWALGALVLLIIVVGVCYLVGKSSVETAENTVDTPSEPEQLAVQPRMKLPPVGENFATGHWEGGVWQRTAPPEPDTVMHEGKPLTLRELLRSSYLKNWEERVAILNRIIAEAPYSEEAYHARDTLAIHDENGEYIYDKARTFERLQPLVAYHPDSPRLLKDLLGAGMHIYPEAAIHYGTEALKYVGRYHMGGGYGAFPERIHHYLGYAYQNIGDYSSALAHHQKTLELIKAFPTRMGIGRIRPGLATRQIDAILAGKPELGPLAQSDRAGGIGGAPVVAPAASQAEPGLKELPRIQPGDPLDASGKHEDADFSGDSRSGRVDPRDLARRAAAQREQQAAQWEQQAAQREQEQQRFDTFVQELHQIATVKTAGDFEKFLAQAMAKRVGGTKTSPAPDTRPSVSADRMRRASQIFRKARTPAAGLKELERVDPDLAKTLRGLPR